MTSVLNSCATIRHGLTLILAILPWPPHTANAAELTSASTSQADVAADERSRELAEATQLHSEVLTHHRAAEYAQAIPKAQRALQLREAVLGPNALEVATDLDVLAELLDRVGRANEAEPLYRRSVAIHDGALGPDHLTWLRLDAQRGYWETSGRYDLAMPFAQQALQSAQKSEGPDHPDVARSLLNLANLFQAQAQYAQAEPLIKQALAMNEKIFGPDHLYVAECLDKLAALYLEQLQYAQAEPLFKRSLEITELRFGPDNRLLAACLYNLGILYYRQGRYTLAEPLLRRSLAMREKVLVPDHPELAQSLSALAHLYLARGLTVEAEALYKRALTIDEKVFGSNNPALFADLFNLATVYEKEGQTASAEELFKRALAISEKFLSPDHPRVGLSQLGLGSLYKQQGHYAQAEPLLQRALAIDAKAFGPSHPATAAVLETLAGNNALQGHFAEAAANLRGACGAQSSTPQSNLPENSVQAEPLQADSCWTLLTLVLSNWSTQGGGQTATDRPDALIQEAFLASQRALQSAAGDALARSAALTAADGAGVGPEAQSYEATLRLRAGLDEQFTQAAGENGELSAQKRRALSQAQENAVARINQLSTQLKLRAPRYWDYRSPDPLGITALQAATGADAALLHEEEALVEFLITPGQGLVFAVNKREVAWARLTLSGDAIRARVLTLRRQIDPQGYDLRGFTFHEGTGSSPIPQPGGFDRQAAYELYQALLGDPAIQAIIRDKPVVLFVPSGPLISLPPGLLVTAPPPGGAQLDADPAALRATAWLLRSKAVAMLPAVSSLRTLRQIRPENPRSTPDPVLIFADPQFRRASIERVSTPQVTARGFNSLYRDGIPVAEALEALPPLPGTRMEGEALERALNGRPGSLLLGREASKAELMRRNTDGRLSRVEVLEFATHGLVSGDVSGLAEPALALAQGATPSDGLLRASEAATLRLNAQWVLLSACNTASPDAPEAQGLSGLSRAFFYAGARTLLVSHWRVRDDIAPRLIPNMLLIERHNPSVGRAQALRQASLAILDDPHLNAANPAAWAPFTVIGEAAR